MPDPLQAPATEGTQAERRKEREVGHVVIFVVKVVKENWKWILMAIAIVFNSPYAKPLFDSVIGLRISPQAQAMAPQVQSPRNLENSFRIGAVESKISVLSDNVKDTERKIEALNGMLAHMDGKIDGIIDAIKKGQ